MLREKSNLLTHCRFQKNHTVRSFIKRFCCEFRRVKAFWLKKLYVCPCVRARVSQNLTRQNHFSLAQAWKSAYLTRNRKVLSWIILVNRARMEKFNTDSGDSPPNTVSGMTVHSTSTPINFSSPCAVDYRFLGENRLYMCTISTWLIVQDLWNV